MFPKNKQQGSIKNKKYVDSKCSICHKRLDKDIVNEMKETYRNISCTKEHSLSIAIRNHCASCCDNCCTRCGRNIIGNIYNITVCKQPNKKGFHNPHCSECCDSSCDYTGFERGMHYIVRYNIGNEQPWQK